ncbi:MAG: hypothetical protein KatS3mg129_1020 [Leptospiraceae bacterium]|nr:MAG: hypothetical protein KatS3mg129_1020 [Leptospiraceae bacterium]
MKALNKNIILLFFITLIYCNGNLENKINQKDNSSGKLSIWSALYILKKGNLCSNENFNNYKILYSNQTYYLEGSFYLNNYEENITKIFAYTVLGIIDEETMLLTISQLQPNILALFVDKDIKLTLEVLQNNCKIVLKNKTVCTEKDKDIWFYYNYNTAGKGYSITSSIIVNSSSMPIATMEYNKIDIPYYMLIEISNYWENGIAPKNCKYKITIEDL